MPDLMAGALAQRNIDRAIQLLEHKKDGGGLGANDTFLLAYLYCLNGSVDKAETLDRRQRCRDKERFIFRLALGKIASRFRISSARQLDAGRDQSILELPVN